jgi:hypothetical protein
VAGDEESHVRLLREGRRGTQDGDQNGERCRGANGDHADVSPPNGARRDAGPAAGDMNPKERVDIPSAPHHKSKREFLCRKSKSPA